MRLGVEKVVSLPTQLSAPYALTRTGTLIEEEMGRKRKRDESDVASVHEGGDEGGDGGAAAQRVPDVCDRVLWLQPLRLCQDAPADVWALGVLMVDGCFCG